MKITGQRCQCTGCGQYFNRVSTFTKHRVGKFAAPGEWKGERGCLTTEGMQAKGWQVNDAGFWITAGGNWRTAP